MAEKRRCIVKFSKGITVSENYQSVRYEIGIEVPVDIDPRSSDFRDEVEKLEEIVNKELRRRKKSTDLHGLGD